MLRHFPYRMNRTTRLTIARFASLALVASVIASLAFALVPAQSAYAASTIIVNTTADENGTGTACSLREALTTANTGANFGGCTGAVGSPYTINLPAGTYNLSTNDVNGSDDLLVGTLANTTIDIVGAGAATTTINQTVAGRMIFNVNPNVLANVVFNLSGVTVTGGSETDTDPDGFGGNGGAILAGGSASAPGNALSITNVVFSGNYCSPTNDAGCSGGAINMTGGGNLTVSNSTFSGNDASKNSGSGSGGAIYFDNSFNPGNVSITGSTFTNNTAHGNSTTGGQGGAVYLAGGAGSTYTVSNNTFTGNAANGTAAAGSHGGALYLSLGSLTASFNRIVGNTNADSSGLYVANNSGSIGSATNNWWGCNGGPASGVGCDTAILGTPNQGGSITVSPWIVLKTTANPTAVNYGATSTLTASFLQNSSAGALTTGQISTLIGLPVTWANAAHGTLSNQQTTIQSNGTATATFTAGSTSADCGTNTGKGEAKVDSVQNGDTTATASVTINCPDLALAKTNNVSGQTQLGNTGASAAQWTWTLTGSNSGPGFASYANGQTIVTDNLPNSNITYGTVTENNVSGVTGTISCSINVTDDLTCTASGAVQIDSSGSFTVRFSATPAAVGTYANPRTSATCAIDPNNNVPETSDANNACSNSVAVTAPDLTVAISNNVSGSVALPNSWTWTLHAANSSTSATATFLSGDTILTDDLDNSGNLSYGTPSAGNGTNITNIGNVSCSIASSTLTCSATGTVVIGTSGSFDVTFTATPSAFGTYTNPRSGGSCAVDPNNVVPETNEANNSCNTDSVAVLQPPAITSADHTTFTVGAAGSFNVTTTGSTPITLSESGALPSGVTFTDNHDGTATLAGTPATGTGGVYPIVITASNGALPNATQSFTLTVNEAPSITSANNTTFKVGAAGSFNVTTHGYPVPAITESGALPSGVTFTDNHDGTATLAGTPASGTGGTYPLTFTASNSVLPNGAQSFTLTVDEAPSITSANSATFTVGSAGSFTVTATGFPASITLTESGALPSGVTFTNNGDGTGTLAGTPASGTAGTYLVTFTANNGVSPNGTQNFTLTVQAGLAITSANNATFVVGTPGSFTVTTSGTPLPTISEFGALPGGVSFTDNGDGTATLSGTPAAGTGGAYSLNLTAHNGVAPDALQAFTLTVDEAPKITSADHTTFAVGQAGSFTVTTGHSYPTSITLSESGALPSGVTFTDNHNGTATLAGTPASGTTGIYPLTFTAANGVSPNGTQSFTLTVGAPPVVTTNPSDLTVDPGQTATFTAAATGDPAPTVQWQFSTNGGSSFSNLSGGNSTTVSFTASFSQNGYKYRAVFTNSLGTATTTAATLTVLAPTSLLYNGGQIANIGGSFTPAALLSSPLSSCTNGQTITFSLDRDPTGATSGSYSLGTATTNSSGQATMGAVSVGSNWAEGIYTITASFARTGTCLASSNDATLTIGSNGDSANGGGWYTLSGSGHINFGFTVRKTDSTCTLNCTYQGQFLLINNGKWRLKGTLNGYVKTKTGTGASSGIGDLYWWNTSLNGGLGDWQLAASGVSFTINFYDSGKSGKNSGDTFGVNIQYTPVPPQPSSLPNSSPQPLKGGNIVVK